MQNFTELETNIKSIIDFMYGKLKLRKNIKRFNNII